MKILTRVIFCPILTLLACSSNPPATSPDSELQQASQAAASESSASSAPQAKAAPAEKEAPVVASVPPEPSSKSIEVALNPKSGSKLSGKAIFTETAAGVHVEIKVEGISPGQHGTHIHEVGDCSAADGSSAGGHFNPHAHEHALPEKAHRHLGDLGNITVDKDGKGTLEITVPGASLKEGDENSFIRRALIVHEKKDDGGQPTGNAGGRIGCAEIK